MQTVEKIWMDGKFVNWADAKVHVLTHTLHYGAGVFEGIRFYNTEKGPAAFRLQDHVRRLYYSAEAIGMKVPYSEEEFAKAILDTIKINNIAAGYIRPICFYGYGKMGLNPEGAPVNCAIAVWPWGAYLGEDAVKVKVSKYIRIHPASTVSDAKISGHYVNSILASLEIHAQGYGEALFLDFEGNVAEGPGENIFVVKDGKIFTPPRGSILPGITRDSVMRIAKDQGITVEEKVLKVADLQQADELFFTGTAAEVSAIASIDDTHIGDGKMGHLTSRIKSLFTEIVNGKNEKYAHWLSHA